MPTNSVHHAISGGNLGLGAPLMPCVALPVTDQWEGPSRPYHLAGMIQVTYQGLQVHAFFLLQWLNRFPSRSSLSCGSRSSHASVFLETQGMWLDPLSCGLLAALPAGRTHCSVMQGPVDILESQDGRG